MSNWILTPQVSWIYKQIRLILHAFRSHTMTLNYGPRYVSGETFVGNETVTVIHLERTCQYVCGTGRNRGHEQICCIPSAWICWIQLRRGELELPGFKSRSYMVSRYGSGFLSQLTGGEDHTRKSFRWYPLGRSFLSLQLRWAISEECRQGGCIKGTTDIQRAKTAGTHS